jgi:hypothetical protein
MELEITSHWHVGVDLGQSHDPTAICVLETKTADIPSMTLPYHVPYWRKKVEEYQKPFNVVHLERLPLGMSYPEQVLFVASLIAREPLKSPDVYIDYTGVGRPVYDLFKAARVPNIIGISITAGKDPQRTNTGWSVPKNILVSGVQAKLHTGQLKVAAGLLDAPVLLKEFQDFRVTFTSAGNAIFNARQGQHDDLVLAVSLAVWGASQPPPVYPVFGTYGCRVETRNSLAGTYSNN